MSIWEKLHKPANGDLAWVLLQVFSLIVCSEEKLFDLTDASVQQAVIGCKHSSATGE